MTNTSEPVDIVIDGRRGAPMVYTVACNHANPSVYFEDVSEPFAPINTYTEIDCTRAKYIETHIDGRQREIYGYTGTCPDCGKEYKFRAVVQ